ncbi:MAG: ROK family protein [Myxococcota bacterium]|nr:ROK family protein [Myxococcota bacterium]
MTRSRQHLVFDVGGTQLRAAVYDQASESLTGVSRVDAPSYLRHADASWPDLRARLIDDMSELRRRVDPHEGIPTAVVAFPGPVDSEHRVVAAPPLWGTRGRYPYSLEPDLRERWPGTDVCVVNDVTAAGYRYVRASNDDFCIVTISSGIGNKVFVRGRPLVGRSGQGGEIGHLQVDGSPTAPTCDCGGRGHLAAIASGRGMLVRARDRAVKDRDFSSSMLCDRMHLTASGLTSEALAIAYVEGDPWATTVVREGAGALGSVLATIHLAIGIDRFVLIGGLALGLGQRFCRDVRAGLHARCWRGESDADSDAISVILGDTDGHCALVGAGRARHLGLLP